MECVIDGDGVVRRTYDDPSDACVWIEGCVRIRQTGRAVFVTLCPRLVQVATLTAAFYELAELVPAWTPTYVQTRPENPRPEQRFSGILNAFLRIYDLVAVERNIDCSISHDRDVCIEEGVVNATSAISQEASP